MEFECLTCGNKFDSVKKDKNRTPKYCTRKCFFQRQITQETRKRQSKAKKGKTPWNKGVNMWKGKEHPRGTRGKKFPSRSGENSHLWRGGVSSENEKIRKSLEYREWRRKIFKRDDFTCVFCGKRGGRLNADHIKPFSKYPNLRFDIDNGRTLCEPCHLKTPTFGSKSICRKMGKIHAKKWESV